MITQGDYPSLRPVPEEDPATGEVVRAHLYEHPVIRQDLDVVLPYLPADVREHLVPILELHPEGGVAQALDDGALELDAACCSSHILALLRSVTGRSVRKRVPLVQP